MNLPLKTAVLWCGLLLCGWARAEEPAWEAFEQKYARQYESINYVDTHAAIAQNRQGQSALIDNANRILVPFGIYDSFVTIKGVFKHNGKLFLQVSHQNKFGLIDGKGKQIIPPQYHEIIVALKDDSPITVGIDGTDGRRYGLVDQDGHILIEPRYSWIGLFSDGLAPYTADPLLDQDGQDNPHIRFGFLDIRGRTVISPQFSDFREFHSGVTWVKHADSGDRLLIDRTGKTLLRAPSYIYQAFENFDANGLAIVKKNGLYGLINTRGESVLAAEYDLIYSPNTQIFYLKKDGKLGVANAQGKMIIPTQFDNSAQWDSNQDKTPPGHIAMIRGTTVFLFDSNGKQIAQRRARAVAACADVAAPRKKGSKLRP